MTEPRLPPGYVAHDGGPCPDGLKIAGAGTVMAIYRRAPDKPARLFSAPMEQWEWTGIEPDIEIIGYLPPAT